MNGITARYEPVHPALNATGAQRRVFIVASVLAAVALLLTIAGPGISHHYGELSPYHSHLFLSGSAHHTHSSIGTTHTHTESGDVVSLSSDAGSSAPGLQIVPVEGEAPVTAHVEHSSPVIYEFSLVIAEPDPPDRPPISS